MTTQDETVVDTTVTTEPEPTEQEDLYAPAFEVVSQAVIIPPPPPAEPEATQEAVSEPTVDEEVEQTTQVLPSELTAELISQLRILDPNQTIR